MRPARAGPRPAIRPLLRGLRRLGLLSPAICVLLFLLVPPGTPALAGGSGESALLVVNPRSREARYLANHYQAARGIPARNVLFMDPGAPSYAAFVAGNLAGFRGTLEERGIAGQIDYVIVMPGTAFHVPAPGLITDPCSPVGRLSIGSAYGLANQAETFLRGGVPASLTNPYFSPDESIVAFDSQTSWLEGQPSAGGDERYFIGAMLGYTGPLGNTAAELVDMIDRSVAADGTHPVGTSYFMQTTDLARSSPRHLAYPAVSAAISALGHGAQHLFADLPIGQHDALGIMTGLASPDVLGADLSLLPGSFADHLTSFAAAFDVVEQTKVSAWIAKGASGSSGAVEEPCLDPGKFPHARMHLYYRKGLSLGEAWLRSMQHLPFQSLLYGDPLARPWAHPPLVDVPGAPEGALAESMLLHPVTAATAPGAAIARVELLVDGKTVRAAGPGQPLPLVVDGLADGWHELRVLAFDDTDARNVGRWIGSFEVARAGRSASLSTFATSGDLSSYFPFTAQAVGADLVELRLVSSGRVIAASTQASDVFPIYGQILGGGPARVQAEALFSDGMRVRSAPIEVQVAFQGGGQVIAPPQVFSYRKRVPPGVPTVVELPANYDYDPIDVAYPIDVAPAQATLEVVTDAAAVVVIPSPAARGTDQLVWRATTRFGSTVQATVHLSYEPAPAPCPDPTSYCAALPSSAGPGAHLGWSGSTSVLQNDLALHAVGAVPGQPGVFFYGPDQVQIPFGDGLRCVGGGAVGLFRLGPPVTPGPLGDVDLALDLNLPGLALGPGAWIPGRTWNVQLWYRDQAAGGAGFNLSDALRIEVCP